jgi:DNA-binding MarR family transcriptional regulator
MALSPAFVLGRFMFALDRAADQLLQRQLAISYNRFIFLTVLEQSGAVTQHQLAVTLGYSDPAVSVMLGELAKVGYVHVTTSPEHKRRHLVTIVAPGRAIVAQGRRLLDTHFEALAEKAGVDIQRLGAIAERLHQALKAEIEGIAQ